VTVELVSIYNMWDYIVVSTIKFRCEYASYHCSVAVLQWPCSNDGNHKSSECWRPHHLNGWRLWRWALL